MAAVDRVLGDVVDDHRLAAVADLVADRRLDLQLAAGPQAELISSFTAQAIQRSSVTRATAAKPMPVVRQTTSRIVGTKARRFTSSISGITVFSIGPAAIAPFGWVAGYLWGAGLATARFGGVVSSVCCLLQRAKQGR